MLLSCTKSSKHGRNITEASDLNQDSVLYCTTEPPGTRLYDGADEECSYGRISMPYRKFLPSWTDLKWLVDPRFGRNTSGAPYIAIVIGTGNANCMFVVLISKLVLISSCSKRVAPVMSESSVDKQTAQACMLRSWCVYRQSTRSDATCCIINYISL